MHIEDYRAYCLSKRGVTEEFPFDNDTLVYKVMGKMFALTSLSRAELVVNLKMDSALTEEWRERYAEITPGWHMNKTHWNSVCLDTGAIPLREQQWLIDHSYEQVVKGLTKKMRFELENA